MANRLPFFTLVFRPASAVLALATAVAGIGCATSRTLTPTESALVFTVDTARARGVLIPLPFERDYVTTSRDTGYDGSTVITYRFDPPERERFPFFFESAAAIYRIPGQASTSNLVFDFSLQFAGVAPGDTQALEFPDLADEAAIAFLHPPDDPELVSGFLLSARTDNRLFILAMAGPPAAVPSEWFPDVEECLRRLASFGSSK